MGKGKNMTRPIFQLWMMCYTAQWYALSQAARQELMAKIAQITKEAGGEALFFYQALWSSERWLAFGVNRFPDLEAINKNAMGLYAIDWFNYVESQVFLGTETGGAPYQAPLPSGGKAVYKAYIMRPTPAGNAVSPEVQQNILGKVVEERKKANLRTLVECDCLWSSEPWMNFGVEQFGCLEDEQAYSAALPGTGLFEYIDTSMTLLGMEMP